MDLYIIGGDFQCILKENLNQILWLVMLKNVGFLEAGSCSKVFSIGDHSQSAAFETVDHDNVFKRLPVDHIRHHRRCDVLPKRSYFTDWQQFVRFGFDSSEVVRLCCQLLFRVCAWTDLVHPVCCRPDADHAVD